MAHPRAIVHKAVDRRAVPRCEPANSQALSPFSPQPQRAMVPLFSGREVATNGLDRGCASARQRCAHPAAQPRGRGVAARGDDAEPRGDHRRGRGPARAERLLQARARLDLRSGLRPAQPGRARRSGHRRRGVAARLRSSTSSAGARRCCGSRPRPRRRRTRRTTPRSSPSSRCCGA